MSASPDKLPGLLYDFVDGQLSDDLVASEFWKRDAAGTVLQDRVTQRRAFRIDLQAYGSKTVAGRYHVLQIQANKEAKFKVSKRKENGSLDTFDVLRIHENAQPTGEIFRTAWKSAGQACGNVAATKNPRLRTFALTVTIEENGSWWNKEIPEDKGDAPKAPVAAANPATGYDATNDTYDPNQFAEHKKKKETEEKNERKNRQSLRKS